jgi:F-box protein 21
VTSKIAVLLDDLAYKFRDLHPNFDDRSPRKKALELASFVQANDLTGLKSEKAYRDLYNNFIGIALQDEDHPSIPLVSVAIYCCIARRLGVDARPCGFPFHVHAMVYPPEGWTLDGMRINPEQADPGNQPADTSHDPSLTDEASPPNPGQDPMYLDPYRSNQETPLSYLKSQLATIGVKEDKHSIYLNGSPTSEIVLRTARNIVFSVQESHQSAIDAGNGDPRPYDIRALPDMEDAFYAALWASIILSTPLPSDRSHRGLTPIPSRQYLPHIVKHFEHQNPMDVTLVERHILPLFCDEHRDEQRDNLLETTRVMRAGDVIPKKVVRRDSDTAVKYKVGHVFRHRRYGYWGVITGWDVECGMDQGWMLQNRVDRLAKGRHQSFYHVLYVYSPLD